MSDIKCIGVLECIGKILDISIVNTEKEFNKVEDKNKQRVQLRANALHSDYSMFIQPFLVLVVGGVIVTLLKTEKEIEK